eukprot:GSMAST32.ASY1.ANO1.247.1 assembled CDS
MCAISPSFSIVVFFIILHASFTLLLIFIRELTTNVCRKQPFCTYTQHGLFSTKLLVLSKQTLF